MMIRPTHAISNMSLAMQPSSNKVNMILNQLIDQEKLTQQHVKGCSNMEIAEIEEKIKNKLPAEYKNFLRFMGQGGGKLFQGEDIFYPVLQDLQKDATSLLRVHQFLSLPNKAFVFYMHQGYEFSFFKLDEGDDPPVYQFYEGQEQKDFLKPWNSFSEFIQQSVEQHLKVWPNLNP